MCFLLEFFQCVIDPKWWSRSFFNLCHRQKGWSVYLSRLVVFGRVCPQKSYSCLYRFHGVDLKIWKSCCSESQAIYVLASVQIAGWAGPSNCTEKNAVQNTPRHHGSLVEKIYPCKLSIQIGQQKNIQAIFLSIAKNGVTQKQQPTVQPTKKHIPPNRPLSNTA